VDASIASIVGIIVVVLALNFYFMVIRMKKENKKRTRDSVAVDEAKQAQWRDKEITRRLEQENDDAVERIKLRDETLAFYEEVRRRYEDENTRKKYIELRAEVLGEESVKNLKIECSDEATDTEPVDTEFDETKHKIAEIDAIEERR